MFAVSSPRAKRSFNVLHGCVHEGNEDINHFPSLFAQMIKNLLSRDFTFTYRFHFCNPFWFLLSGVEIKFLRCFPFKQQRNSKSWEIFLFSSLSFASNFIFHKNFLFQFWSTDKRIPIQLTFHFYFRANFTLSSFFLCSALPVIRQTIRLRVKKEKSFERDLSERWTAPD